MYLLNKLHLQKIVLLFTVLLLTACGGGASTKATTPSTADLQNLAANAVAQAVVVAPTGLNSNQIVSAGLSATAGQPIDAGLPPIADVFIGTIDLPYYFDTSNSTTSFWLPSLDVRETLNVPVLMTLPNNSPAPATGWPIVMFQHGITQDRTNLLAIAHAFAAVGFAAVAIDLPTHGLIDAANPLHADNPSNPFPNDVEQTFGQNATSGQNFINLASLLTSRDNFRQGAANLITLRASLGGIINAAAGGPVLIDTNRVAFVGHSLGGMVGVSYLGAETTPTPSSILNAGATITDVLQNSQSFSPVIEAGLANLGVTTPAGIAGFYANAQELIDAGEPANFAAAAAATHPIHLVEVLGDATVPNSSTENLADIMGAFTISNSTTDIAPGNPGIVRFVDGDHSSPLSPAASLPATIEIQSQVATFLATGGTTILVDPTNTLVE